MKAGFLLICFRQAPHNRCC